MSATVSQPPIRSVSVTKSSQAVAITPVVRTALVADVGQSGPQGAAGLNGVTGVKFGTTPPTDLTFLWVDTN